MSYSTFGQEEQGYWCLVKHMEEDDFLLGRQLGLFAVRQCGVLDLAQLVHKTSPRGVTVLSSSVGFGTWHRCQKDPSSLCLLNAVDAIAEVRESLFRRLIYGLAMMMLE